MSTASDGVELVGDETTKNVARAVVFAAATSATAPVSLTHPLVPNVPITLQTLWVFLAGIVLGPIWAGVSFVLYLLAGLIGLPVFAGGGSGVGVLVGPTGGFLVGFPLATVAVGVVAHGLTGLESPRKIPVPRLVAAMVAGGVVVYALGAIGFSIAQGVGLVSAVSLVVLPFLPVAALKMAAAVVIARSDAVVAR